ncbi:MAG: response regulator transcription factor [Brumimicrobium sp.]|nr:response regulator transcription factor [Brumimicrobium sp.]
MKDKIKILIVDDHNLIAQAWMSILKAEQSMEVVGIATGETEAIQMAQAYRPNIVLMDINLKQGDGFEATKTIMNKLPKVNVIGLSIHDDTALVKKLLSNGAKGYLTKNSSKEELIRAIEKVDSGEQYICEEIKDKFVKTMFGTESSEPELTNREIEIVKLIAGGLTSKEIGNILNVSNRTVDTHRHNILKKLNLPNSAQLSIWAKNKGYI